MNTEEYLRYESLSAVLNQAFQQAINGKGRERHGTAERFEDQIGCILTALGCDFATGQACKKAIESLRLSDEDAIKELLGAINYLAIKVIVLQKRRNDE